MSIERTPGPHEQPQRPGVGRASGSGESAEGVEEPGDEEIGRGAVLLVTPEGPARDQLAARLASRGVACLHAGTCAEAARVARRRRAPRARAALIAWVLPDGAGPDLIEELHRADPALACVLMRTNPTLDDALDAMRHGACDLVAESASADELASRMLAAGRLGRAEGRRQSAARRLRERCRALDESRRELTRQVGGLCADLAESWRDARETIERTRLAAEFNGLIRQDLDVESVLRTTLEYMLATLGPMNAGVFLPAESGDFSLGAYVNYDRPRDAAEVMLDRLASILPSRFQDHRDLAVLTGESELEAGVADAAEWLADSTLLVMPCRQEGECLAIVALFRDRRNPFSEATRSQVRLLGELFGKQLSRVIHVHHRNKPRPTWGATEAPNAGDDSGGYPGDDIDLAA